MDEVRVTSPYLPESVIGGTPAANDRVKKVVRVLKELTKYLNLYLILKIENSSHVRFHFLLQLEFERKRLRARSPSQR